MRRIPLRRLFYLPNADRAWIPEGRLENYCLNAEHHQGRHKARMFQDYLGIGIDDADYLSDELLRKVRDHRVESVAWNQRAPHWKEWGLEFTVHIPVDGRNGTTHPVITGWYWDNTMAPRLTTARPKGKK